MAGAPKHKTKIISAHNSWTPPRPALCRKCHAPILGCTYDALPLKLDPYPLSPLGELWSCYSGCKTFLLAGNKLWVRNSYAVMTSPTGLGGFILRSHLCGNWIPPQECLKLKTNDYESPGF